VIYAIDPGCTKSTLVLYDEWKKLPHESGEWENTTLVQRLDEEGCSGRALVVEQMVSTYRQAVGSETLETMWWAGRFHQAWNSPVFRIPRESVRKHFANGRPLRHVGDVEIREALIQRYGGKENAKGTKKLPGPLYQISKHGWAALALAITLDETHNGKELTGSAFNRERA